MSTVATNYESNILSRLQVSDPTLDTGLGTPIRKLITAVAMEISNYATDRTVTSTLYAIESVSGSDLDALVAQFGFTRQEARHARGTITLSRDNGDSTLQISYGTQFAKPSTTVTPSVLFQSTAYGEMPEGVLSVDISVMAVTAGASGNVPANTITNTAYSGYCACTNANPTTGGRDAETDADLRKRFINTVFRNEAGTKDQYNGLALAHSAVSRANLIAQESRYSEIVQVTADTDGKYIATVSASRWSSEVERCLDTSYRYWVKDTDTDEVLSIGEYQVINDGAKVVFNKKMAAEFVGPIEYDAYLNFSHKHAFDLTVTSQDGATISTDAYRFDDTDKAAGRIYIPSTSTLASGDSVKVSYSYYAVVAGDFVTIYFDCLSKINRGGLKTVELFVDGVKPVQVSDIQFVDFDKLITSSNVSNWVREDGTPPVSGHLYIPLSYQPLYTGTGAMNVGVSTVLSEHKHFRMLYDSSKKSGSGRCMDAVELIGTMGLKADKKTPVFITTVGSLELEDETPVDIPYFYNEVPSTIQSLIDQQSVLTMDGLVHEAHRRYFGIYLSLMYDTFPRDTVKSTVTQALLTWANNLPFGPAIQFSDIETAAANTVGVDNVRVARAGDTTDTIIFNLDSGDITVDAIGIVEYHRDGESYVQQFTTDFQLRQDEIFEIQYVTVYGKTSQNWG